MIVPNDRIAKNTYDNLKSNLVELPNPQASTVVEAELKDVKDMTQTELLNSSIPKIVTKDKNNTITKVKPYNTSDKEIIYTHQNPKQTTKQIRKNNLNKIKQLEQLKNKPLSQIKKDIPNFSTLFKGSKMVDEKGNPIVLYRGVRDLTLDPTEILKYKKSKQKKYIPKSQELEKLESDYFGDTKNLPYEGKNRSELDEQTDILNLAPKDYGKPKADNKRKFATVFASDNLKQALSYARYQDNKIIGTDSRKGIIPFYINASEVIEHKPKLSEGYRDEKGIARKRGFYNWTDFDRQAEKLTGSQVLIFKSDKLEDAPGFSDTINDSVKAAREADFKEKLPSIKDDFEKANRQSYVTGDSTMIVAFGPDVQIIPAIGRVPELDRLGLKSERPTKAQKLQKRKELNESVINKWKEQSQQITDEIARKKDVKQMDDTYPEIPLYNPENRFVNDPKLIDSSEIAEASENTGPSTYIKDELYKGERGSKIKPKFPEYAKGGEVSMAEQTEMAFMNMSYLLMLYDFTELNFLKTYV